MPDRKMFWRIVRRLFAAQRGRLFVILLALGAGAAVTAALLNIRVDAASRLTKEFRTFGANVVVAPRASVNSATAASSRRLPSHASARLLCNARTNMGHFVSLRDCGCVRILFQGNDQSGCRWRTRRIP